MAFISIARLVRRVSPFLALAGLSAVPAVAQPSGLGPSQVSLYAEVAGPNPVQARTRAQTVQGTYEEVAEVVASIPDAGGRYGANVDLSGTRAVVGAFRDGAQNEGAAYVYDLVNGVWTLSARLTASNAVADEFFGSAVSLDGDRVLIGASGDAPLGGSNRTGAAYIFDRNPASGIWSETARLSATGAQNPDEFGNAVSLDGDRALVGARSALSNAGAAYVFDLVSGSWAQTATITPSNGDNGHRFGFSVSLDGNRAAIGARDWKFCSSCAVTGAAYVFDRQTSGQWTQTSFLQPQPITGVDDFGFSLDLEGDRLLVGEPFNNNSGGADRGAAYIAELSGGGWSFVQKIIADPNLASNGSFGVSVSLDGDRALVGEFVGPVGGVQAGSAFVFDLVGGTWTETQRLTASDPEDGARFGRAVALDGGRALVGADFDNEAVTDGGSAYFFSVASVDVAEAGWQMLAAPSASETFGSFLAPIWTQCFPGADDNGPACSGAAGPNVFRYDETVDGLDAAGYVAPGMASMPFAPGTGAFVFVFADDDLDGTADPFPKTLFVAGDEPSLPFSFSPTYTDNGDGGTDVGDDTADDGWNLLGNPFRAALDWDDLYGLGAGAQADGDVATNLDPTAYVYDPASGYAFYNASTNTGTLAGGLIPEGSGFWVRANAANPTLTKGDGGGGGGGARVAAVPHVVLRAAAVAPDGREISGSAVVALTPDASLGADRGDAVLLGPVQAPHVTLGVARADGVPLAQSALPADLASGTEVDLALGVEGVATSASVTWDLALPDGWTATLLDRATGTEAVLADGGRYALDLTGVADTVATGRLALRLTRSAVSQEAGPEASALALSAPAPNPASDEARVRLRVPEAGDASVRVYDSLGRHVLTAFEGSLAAGAEVVVGIGTGPLAPGLYVVRAEGAGTVVARTLTVTR